MNGIVIIDKPQDFTSFDVVAVVRKYTHQKKLGHTGTLDPNATGVLPILLGSATKAQDLILNHDKSYTAGFKFGITTDTLDIWGKVTAKTESNITKAQILLKLDDFRGEISQIPPMYSAIQKNGKRLYDLARKGIEVERESRKVTIYSLELLDFDEKTQSGVMDVSCSKGTYIRTLIDDIGKCLNIGAVMTSLKRNSACGYTLNDCMTLDDVKKYCEDGSFETKLLSIESLFETLRYVVVTDAQAKRFSNGGELDIDRTYIKDIGINDNEIFRVKDKNRKFLGLGKIDKAENMLKIFKLF